MNQLIAPSRHYVPGPPLAAELIERYGSPLYVYDADHLDGSIQAVSQSIAYPRKRFAFAAVTNGNITLLRRFLAAGWGLHANTPGDAYLGLRAGFAPKDIIYSGSNLSPDDMMQMLRWQIGTFNLDSISQLEQLCKLKDAAGFTPRLGFRLNMPHLTGESRIGVSPAELLKAQDIAQQRGLEVGGIHFYRGTSTNETQRFGECIDEIIRVGESLHNWQYLDFGGGFGFAYFDRRHAFEWSVFGQQLTDALVARNSKVQLVIEPGRSIIAGAGVILCTVVSTKWQGDKQIVGVDATTSNIAVLSVHGGVRQVRSYRTSEEEFATDVCGNTTYSKDYLARNCRLPEVSPGDTLAILDCGAYGYAMSSHFLHRPRVPEVLVEAGQHRLIRKRETFDCLIANQVIDE